MHSHLEAGVFGCECAQHVEACGLTVEAEADDAHLIHPQHQTGAFGTVSHPVADAVEAIRFGA